MKNQLGGIMLICCLMASCQLDNGISDKYEVGVREDIILQMHQELSPAGSSLEFVFSSSSATHCEGAGFDHETVRELDDITIHLINLHRPDSCTGSTAIARQHVEVTSLKGTYELSIDLGQLIHNKGKLHISDTSFRLEMGSRFGLQIPHLEMRRIPQSTIWGYAYHPQQQPQANAVVAAKLDLFATTLTLDPGYYGSFELQPSGKMILHTDENIPGAENFIASFNADLNVLTALVEDIRLSLPPGTEFRLYAWQGSKF